MFNICLLVHSTNLHMFTCTYKILVHTKFMLIAIIKKPYGVCLYHVQKTVEVEKFHDYIFPCIVW